MLLDSVEAEWARRRRGALNHNGATQAMALAHGRVEGDRAGYALHVIVLAAIIALVLPVA